MISVVKENNRLSEREKWGGNAAGPFYTGCPRNASQKEVTFELRSEGSEGAG